MGTLTMELGGKVTIECSKTGYTTEMDFKLRVSICELIQIHSNLNFRAKLPGGKFPRGKFPGARFSGGKIPEGAGGQISWG